MPARPRIVVAVDGPSGSGKSSVCREVARRLGLSYLDTGAMYRAVCWSCLDRGIDLDDRPAVAERALALDLQLSVDPDVRRVVVDDTDVTVAIRTTAISMAVSQVARNLDVRAELVRRQRQVIDTVGPGCIAEGRDVTSVVAPDADARILLTADAAARIRRRTVQLHGEGAEDRLRVETAAQVTGRDARDSEVTQFHEAGEGVVAVDTSELDVEQTVVAVVDVVRDAVMGRHGEAFWWDLLAGATLDRDGVGGVDLDAPARHRTAAPGGVRVP